MSFEKLNTDLIINIIKIYLKSQCVIYYCNLKLVNKNFNINFNTMLKNCIFKKFEIPNELILSLPINFDDQQTKYNIKNIEKEIKKYKTKSYYYIKSNKYKINFCKISFYNSHTLKPFYIIMGEEGKLLCDIKEKQSKYKHSDHTRYFQSLNNFEYIEI